MKNLLTTLTSAMLMKLLTNREDKSMMAIFIANRIAKGKMKFSALKNYPKSFRDEVRDCLADLGLEELAKEE